MYATQQNLVERFGDQELIELTDRSNIGEIDAVVLTSALVDADSEINSYLVSRYPLPLTQTSDELVRLACDIARYRLWDVRASEQIKARYDAAIGKLRDISRGTASLSIDTSNKEIQETGSVNYSAPDRVFNDNALSGY